MNKNKIRTRKSDTVFHFACVDCGADVEITLGEILFYDDKKLVVPKRCKECKWAKDMKFKHGTVDAVIEALTNGLEENTDGDGKEKNNDAR